jgi:hypothetical protein
MASRGKWANLAQQAADVGKLADRAATGQVRPKDAEAYAGAARELLQSVQAQEDATYLARLSEAVVADEALQAFDFGATDAKPPWTAVQPDSVYSPAAGFGWLPAGDDTQPTPEETYYAGAAKYGEQFRGPEPTKQSLLFWPYKQPIPAPLRMNLSSATSRTFRVDLPAGNFRVRAITTNPSWTNRNFLVSGMVSVNGAVQLLDAVHDRGAVVAREFQTGARNGKLDFTFGGPTGWAVCAVILKAAGAQQGGAPIAIPLAEWRVSPRFANPDWWPIRQVRCSPEGKLERLPEPGWTLVKAPPGGWPMVDLGTNKEAEIGDVAYAAATVESPVATTRRLHFGASSQAQLWLNGAELGYVPNEKGVREDELVVPVKLRRGRNVLVAKLQRFWERRWMFYGALTD